MKPYRTTDLTPRRLLGAITFALVVLAAGAARADAACTVSLRANLDAGTAALARGAAHDRRGQTARAGADDAVLARAVDRASTEIATCPAPQYKRTFYALSAWKSILTNARIAVDPNIARANARILREKVALYYRYGGAASDPRTYAALKDAVREAYARTDLAFCSPERSADACAIAAHAAQLRASRARLTTMQNLRPRCALPNLNATVIEAVQPDYPAIARAQGVSGTTLVSITIAPDGSVQSPAIYKTSGNVFLDRAAMVAAKASTYHPARRACQNVSERYVFRSEFTP